LADRNSALFQQLVAKLNVSNDDFIRTTQERHKRSVQALWRKMADAGDIYLDKYQGWYSVRDEAFYAESELTTAEDGQRLSPQGTPVEWTEEETFFFRLSAYQDRLLAHYKAQPEFIRPDSRRNEVLSFVRGGLTDLSISRTSFDWGIPVPDAPGHVMYVWVDALTNYITGVGYPDTSGAFERYWPAVHIIGKDIVRFHAVYWPAFLMSAGLPLPKSIFGHGFITIRGEKMSKSAGNVVDPIEMVDRFGVDAVRYFFLREVPFGQDGSYSAESLVARYNADLANSFGNLIQRVVSFLVKNVGGKLPEGGSEAGAALRATVERATRVDLPNAFAAFDLSVGIEAWLRAVYACNQFVDTQAPWALRKTDPEKMEAVLGDLLACIHDLAIAISPVIPESANKVLELLGVPKDQRDLTALTDADRYARLVRSGYTFASPTPIFPRLELPADTADAG
jgi:methionyl-tRNA synthetase